MVLSRLRHLVIRVHLITNGTYLPVTKLKYRIPQTLYYYDVHSGVLSVNNDVSKTNTATSTGTYLVPHK